MIDFSRCFAVLQAGVSLPTVKCSGTELSRLEASTVIVTSTACYLSTDCFSSPKKCSRDPSSWPRGVVRLPVPPLENKVVSVFWSLHKQ